VTCDEYSKSQKRKRNGATPAKGRLRSASSTDAASKNASNGTPEEIQMNAKTEEAGFVPPPPPPGRPTKAPNVPKKPK